MATGLGIGIGDKLYLNTATFASPTWSEIKIVDDVTLTIDMSFAEIKARISDWVMNLPAMKTLGLEFGILHDTSVTARTTLRDAFLNKTVVDLAIADQAIATTGCEYLRSDFYIGSFPIDQKLEEANKGKITAKVAYHATHVPAFTNVA